MMGLLALIFGLLGGLCAIMGIITAAEIMDPPKAGFTAMFWLTLSVILLLATIAFSVSESKYD